MILHTQRSKSMLDADGPTVGRVVNKRCIRGGLAPFALAVVGSLLGFGSSSAMAQAANCNLPLLSQGVAGAEGNISITSASVVPAGPGATGSYSTGPLPEYCRVVGVARPTSDSNINFEVWLPTSTWNGKYLSASEGGFAGSITYNELGSHLQRGYATASTDTGHSGADGPNWMVNHPERVTDYGYRGKHLQTVAAKALISAFYGQAPRYSYFAGCSNGGRQGEMELQRYPDDYDGYIIGDPANNWTGQTTYWMWMNQAFADPASIIPEAKLPAIDSASRAQCDALDGVTDGIISDPRVCKFNVDVLACPAGQDNNSCLTPPQLTGLKKAYQGPRDAFARQLFPPDEPGAEAAKYGALPLLNFGQFVTNPGGVRSTLGTRTVGGMLYNIPPATYDPLSFNFNVDPQTLTDVLGGKLNATNPNLQVQKAKGIKVLHYHGWADAALSPRESVKYYNRVAAVMGGFAQTQDFYRLYMVPGMAHCSWGPGPNAFGNPSTSVIGSASQEDIVKALEQWVEHGVAPGSLIATKYVNDDFGQSVLSRRPICVYPQVQKYIGGDPNVPSSFTCTQGDPVTLVKMVPDVLNLRTGGGVVTALLTVEAGGLGDWSISGVKVGSASAFHTARTSDGKGFVVTFAKNDLLTLPAGTAIDVDITGTLERGGVQTPFIGQTVVRVAK